jgi:hypothetical protein
MLTKETIKRAKRSGFNFYLRPIEDDFPFPILWAKTHKEAIELTKIYSPYQFEIIPL